MGKRKRTTRPDPLPDATNAPWISMRSSLITIGVLSVALAGWTAWQASAFKPLGESLLWGAAFGGGIWLVFIGAYFFNRWVRPH